MTKQKKIKGIGYYTTEEIIFNDQGEILTNRTWNYRPPGAKDIPINFRIKFPENIPNPVGVLRSKGRLYLFVCVLFLIKIHINMLYFF